MPVPATDTFDADVFDLAAFDVTTTPGQALAGVKDKSSFSGTKDALQLAGVKDTTSFRGTLDDAGQ